MPLKNLTVDEVRKEIVDIISRYPDRTGGDAEGNEKSCVYYKDANSTVVTYGDKFDLVIPVGIVGQWVEDFHPELKEDEDFQVVLFMNSVLHTSHEAARVLGEEVKNFLSGIQTQQDNIGVTWKDLSF